MLRLGDGFYYGDASVGRTLYSEAARMYAAAASTGNPQVETQNLMIVVSRFHYLRQNCGLQTVMMCVHAMVPWLGLVQLGLACRDWSQGAPEHMG